MDELIYFGDTVKALDDGRVGGYLVRFSTPNDPDLEGDFFTTTTEFGILDADKPVLYNHGFDGKLKGRPIGRATLRMDDVGIWVEAQLNMRDEYEHAIMQLAEAGKLGWSSGAMSGVEREAIGKAHHIKTWVIGEASLTPTPAEPRNGALLLKSHLLNSEQSDEPEAVAEAHTGATAAVESVVISEFEHKTQEITIMSDEIITTDSGDNHTADPVEFARADEVKGINDKLDQLTAYLQRLETEPAAYTKGVFTVDGGAKADTQIKNATDFLMSVYRGDHDRLVKHYKAQSELSGPAGNYLVPEVFLNEIIDAGFGASEIITRVTRRNVSSNRGRVAAIDSSTAPSAGTGATAFAGGVTMSWTEDGGSITEDQVDFNQIEFNIHKLAGLTVADNELIDDANNIAGVVSNMFGRAYNAMLEYAILRGNGVGKPLGILNSPAAIGVTPNTNNTFNLTDVYAMASRLHSVGGSPVWMIHTSIWPDVGALETSGGGGVWQANMAANMPSTLLGYPLIVTEHLPVADTSGAVVLADLSAYYLFDRRQLTIAFSEHYKFNTDQGAWRFTARFDGQPGLESAITLADPGGATTVSPFVYHND